MRLSDIDDMELMLEVSSVVSRVEGRYGCARWNWEREDGSYCGTRHSLVTNSLMFVEYTHLNTIFHNLGPADVAALF